MNNYHNKIDFYQLFNIDKNDFSEGDLKKAYYRLSLQYHPEGNSKMGDMFKYINRAYEILNSKEKRKLYNDFGLDAFNGVEIKEEYMKFVNKPPSNHKKLNDFEVSVFDDLNENSLFRYEDESSDDMSSELLNYSYLSTGVKYKELNDDILPMQNDYKIDVTLEELYCGCEKKIEIKRKVICPECFGNNESFILCESCLGTGVTYNVNIEQEVTCADCDGYGKRKIFHEKCLNCHGEVTIFESKVLVAHIRPGMKHNEKIIFKGEGNQSLKSPPEDIIAVINVLPHSIFSTNGNDLIINVKITLKEALCGLRRRIKFLDGAYLSIMTNPGEVITPNSVKCYRNKGFIKNVGSKEKGNLKIKFIVQFPENNWTTLEDIKILEEILSKSAADKKVINENKYLSMYKDNDKKDYYKNRRKDYPSPASSLSSPKTMASTPSTITNKSLKKKKNVIDTFYQCDIQAEGNRNPRTISAVDISILNENNPPRGASVIDSLITPLPGENISNSSLSSYNDDYSDKGISPNMNPLPNLNPSPSIKPPAVAVAPSAVVSASASNYPSNTQSMKISPSNVMKLSPNPKNINSSTIVQATTGIRSSPKAKNITSPHVRALRRTEDKEIVYSDDDNYKTIKVVSNKSQPPRFIKSQKESEIIEGNKQVIDDSNRNESFPPPLPPFPKQLSHTRTTSLEHNYFKNQSFIVTNSKGKIIHSNTFHGRDKYSKQSNYDIRSKTMDRVNYSNYDQNI
ncbi:hypothetical protein H8356DRAFT_1708135 [Neocallimastix lanati (nom. inval.)]|nr:hypothetical protein H8356DRAFT_1708135 [Neocallimastix sp. JGI-2020a]